MQQIYKSEPGRFHEIIKQFEVEARTVTNFRSSPEIVATLNKIYNDKDLQQAAHSKKPSRRPRVHFAADAAKLEALLRSESTLVLSVHNSSIFESLGSRELFRSLQAMPEHGFNSRYTAVAVLTESDWEQVQNPLVRLLYGLLLLEENFEQQLFGSAIQMIRKYPSVFGSVSLERHDDKDRLSKGFESLFSVMRKSDVTIGQVVERVGSLDFLKPADVSGFLDDPASAALLDVPLVQVRSTYLFNKNPKRSTQHGVKGESHESVIFMAETSTGTPVVHMGKLFDLWPRIALNLRELEEFAGLMSLAFEEARAKIGVNISSLKADGFAPVAESVTAQAQAILEDYGSLPLFSELYEADFAKYLAKENVTNAKRLFKLSSVEGLLAAYRLFYVGCSRAKTELDVIIPVKEVADLNASKAKLEELGFEVTVHTGPTSS
jgi:DNA helicase-2/ATP-dependent DNA helicase PcrA